MSTQKLTLIFDESVGDDYKTAFEESGQYKIVLTTRQRRATGRKRFNDPEIFNLGGYKYPVVTRDCVMTGETHKPYKKAGKIILRQPDKNKGETKQEYKKRITKYNGSTPPRCPRYDTSIPPQPTYTLIPQTQSAIDKPWNTKHHAKL